jgi:phosphopantothenoylcysteine decarboxylase/phosphopantothenate--cysteine ligase
MKILLTAGPTHEPIDAVRYIGNRSSGRMGASLVEAARRAGHEITMILGPATEAMPAGIRRIDVETAQQMLDAVLAEFPKHDLLIMAAAVADYRPKKLTKDKIARKGDLIIECEATEDIVAAAGRIKNHRQRTIGFSLETAGNIERSKEKLQRKKLDLIVYNPVETMNSRTIESILIWPDGRTENLPCRSKADFADILIQRAVELLA